MNDEERGWIIIGVFWLVIGFAFGAISPTTSWAVIDAWLSGAFVTGGVCMLCISLWRD